MSTMADKFEELGVIPVVVLNDVKDALQRHYMKEDFHVQK